jgi:hypothetical protein
MRTRHTLLLTLTFALAAPLFAARSKSQSYITYDDGGTVIRQAEDGKEIDGRVNLPVFPGDEVATSRRGRAEIRLSDGNILALDRATSVHFRSILDSYDGDSSQTVVELKYGHVAIERTDSGDRDMLRLDTPSASYAATEPAVYAVEADESGRDRVTVLDGVIEVRTPARTTRVRAGEEAHVDGEGIYGLVSSRATDDFERWFQQRSQKYDRATSRYLDRSLAYSEYDLDGYGSWVYASGTDSWCWRPHVNVGWRPYYNGYWRHSPGGLLVWVSYEPWGWTPYHYGRWAYDPFYGWVWAPGTGYAPAWVYWMYGPSYIGWAPMGWYDCYRPYYGWAGRPYFGVGIEIGGGFYGHVRPGDIDLRPWTFVTPNSITATRIDQAALTTDAVRARLLRGDGVTAAVSSAPARFSRSELKDPAAAVGAIVRRGIGSGTGTGGSGSPAADMTPFFRRDPELSNAVRDRIVRSRPVDVGIAPRGGGSGSGIPALSGVPSPGTPGTLEGRVSRGETRDSGNDTAPGTVNRGGSDRSAGAGSEVQRGHDPASAAAAPSTAPYIDRGSGRTSGRTGGNNSSWRDERVGRPAATSPAAEAPAEKPADHSRDDSWRGRIVGRTPEAGGSSAPRSSAPPAARGTDRSDVPRRIIDRIGGARIYDGGSSGRDTSREATPRYEPRSVPRESGGSRDSGSSSARDSGRVERSSPPPSHDSGSRSSGGGSSSPSSGSHDSGSHSSGGQSDGGGKVKRGG